MTLVFDTNLSAFRALITVNPLPENLLNGARTLFVIVFITGTWIAGVF